MKRILSAAVALAMAACGGLEAGGIDEGHGSLAVTVQAVTAPDSNFHELGEVQSVVVSLTRTLPSPLAPIELTLARDGASNSWTAVLSDVLVGTYTGVATIAFNGGRPAIQSTEAEVEIVEGETANLLLFVNQAYEYDFAPPFFTSISMNKASVKMGQTLELTVGADGGVEVAPRTLTLTGRHWGVTPDDERGTFTTATFPAGGTGTITFTAPAKSTSKGFVIKVEDAAHNVAEMGVMVMVDATGTMNVEVLFNFAPVIMGSIRTLNDPDGTWVYLAMDVVDWDAATSASVMHYEWESDCGGNFFDYATPPLTLAMEGDFLPAGPGTHAISNWKYGIPRGEALSDVCTLTLHVADDRGATATANLEIHTDLLLPDVD